jgi:starch phosphorylase
MSTKKVTAPRVTAAETLAALRRQYGSGPVELTGSENALYERHLLFDNVADPATVGARERYEAFARSVRDVLSQRWVRTEQTYERANPKRVYYLSMEFLIGRSLANNVANMLLSPFVGDFAKQVSLDWLGLLEEDPTRGWATAG